MDTSIVRKLTDYLNLSALLIYILLIVFSLFFVPNTAASADSDAVTDDTHNWYYKYRNDDNNWLRINVSTYVKEYTPIKGERYHLVNTLPDKLSPDYAIRFKAQNCLVMVSINGLPIYTDIPYDGIDSVTHTGIVNHIVSIPSSGAGQTLDISFIPCTDYDSYLIDTIYCGGSDDLMRAYIRDRIPLLILSSILVLVGVLLFLGGISEHKTRSGQKHFHLGLLSILFGLYSISQLDLLPMFMDHAALLYNIEILTIALFPYPMLHVCALSCEVLPTTRQRIIQIIPILFFFVIGVTYVTGWIPLYQSKSMILIFTFIMVAICWFYCLYYIIRKKWWHNPAQYAMPVINICFLSALVIDWILFSSGMQLTYPPLSNCILFYTTFLSLFRFIRETKHFAHIGRNAEALQDAAYYDSLTSLGNRTALNRDMEALEHTLNSNSSIAIIQLDINYLKRTNDILGHIAGDRLLQNAAQAIRAGFNNFGKCYRFGGDEFVIILIDNPREKYNLGISAMEKECEHINRNLQKLEHVSIAYGIAYYSPETDTSLWRVQERADEAMYERKRRMKANKTDLTYKDDRL